MSQFIIISDVNMILSRHLFSLLLRFACVRVGSCGCKGRVPSFIFPPRLFGAIPCP